MKFWQYLILFLVVLLVPGKVYLAAGMPYTHDGENHLARFANYKVAVRELQIPPRFAPNLYSGFGYPVFNFNYPLANIMSLPFSVFDVPYILTFKLLAIASLWLLGVGSWWWISEQTKNSLAGWLVSIGLLSSPYVLNLTYVRGSIGELMALAIIPWLGWLVIKTVSWHSGRAWWILSVVIAALLLSHNLLGPAGLGIVWIWFLLTQKITKEGVVNLLGGTVFGIMMSLWFWLPALLEKQLVLLDDSPISKMASSHLVGISQLIFGRAQFGFSQVGQIDTMNMMVGLGLLAGFVLAGGFLLRQLLAKQFSLVSLWWLIGVGLLLGQTNLASFIWQQFKFIQIIQFPWRLTAIWLWVAGWSLGTSWPKLNKVYKGMIVFLLISQIVMGWRMKAVDRFSRTNLELDTYSQSTSTMNENLPKTFKLDTLPNWLPQPEVIKENHAAFTVHQWQGSKRSYKLIVNQPALIIEPTMYFLGWQTTANGQLVSYVDSSEIGGRIAYVIEQPGEYEIKSRFTQSTWPRLLGNTLSLITFGVITSYAVLATKLAKN